MNKAIPYFENDTTTVPITHTFLTPLRVRVNYPDGTTVLTGYGIGEQVEIMEPSLQSLVANHEHWKDIPLSTGAVLLDVPYDYKLYRVWNG